jgi:hypothetical protein
MTLNDPGNVMARLEDIENDLAVRQNAWESAARRWFGIQGDLRKDWATAFLTADGNATEKRAAADQAMAGRGGHEQAEYEAIRAVVKVLETRATIGMSILKAQGRAAA